MMKRIVLSILFSLLAACGQVNPDSGTEQKAPVLVSTEPADGISNLEGTTLSVRFNFDMPVVCPDGERAKISAGSAKIEQVFAPGSYVRIDLSALKAGESYTLKVPSGCIVNKNKPELCAKELTFSFSMKKEEEKPEEPYGNLKGIAATLALGWNLGNQMDAFYNGTWAGDKFLYPDETVWGNGKCTQALFDALKEAGFSSVRIPVTWLKMIGPAPDYKIDKTWLDRVAEIAGYAHNAGLNAIVNTHHDEDHCLVDGKDRGWHTWLNVMDAAKDPELNAQIKEEVAAVWGQIATKFKDAGDWLIFESFNEINDGGWGWSEEFRANPSKQCNVLNEWNQTFVNAVRAAGGCNEDRWLGVPGYCAGIDFLDYFKLPNDPAGRIMLAVHYYDPFDYASGAKYTEWGHTADPAKKASYGDESYVEEKFSKLYRNYVSRGIPVYLGEYGCVNRANAHDRAFQSYYMEYVTRAARYYGLPCFLWDNGAYEGDGENFGYFRHTDGAYIGEAESVVKIMVKAMYDPDNKYTLKSIYDNAPR